MDTNVWLDEVRRQVGGSLGEEPIAACPMSHTGFGTRYGLSKATQHFGMLPQLLARTSSKMVSKSKAGGLPEKVIVVVTPSKVYAFGHEGYPNVGRKPLRIEAEPAAVWERAGLHVSSKPGSVMTTVTFESPSESEKVALSVGNAPFTTEFLGLLGAA